MYEFFIEYPFEIVATWACEQCVFTWEALLLGEQKRFIGQILDRDTAKVLWSNPLPRERDKAIIMLELELVKRSDRHKKMTHEKKEEQLILTVKSKDILLWSLNMGNR